MLRCVPSKIISNQWRSLYLHTVMNMGFATESQKTVYVDVEPPFKRHRDENSVIRALLSCVKRVPETPNFLTSADPWLESPMSTRACILAKSKGRMAARIAARDFFPNDIAGIAKEVPCVDRWIPIQTPDYIIKLLTEGSITNVEAMDRLISLFATKHAWKLYDEIAVDENWSEDMLHRLLDLLCATNGGQCASTSARSLNQYDRSCLPEPDEIYYADELSAYIQSRTRAPINTEASHSNKTSPNSSAEIDDSLRVDEVDGVSKSSLSASDECDTTGKWSMHGIAEQLFTRNRDVFTTPAAYRSVISGAAKFGDPDRAMELLAIVKASSKNPLCIDYHTYLRVIRSVHALKSVRSGKDDVWHYILHLVNEIKSNGQQIDIAIYTNIFHTLNEVMHQRKMSALTDTSKSAKLLDYAPIALGLMDELRSIGLTPKLGTIANFFRLLNNSLSPVKTHYKYATYSCVELLDKYLNDVESLLNDTSQSTSHYDAWHWDDLHFFPAAMRIAWFELDLQLGEKINNLLVGSADRRFLFPTSVISRNYHRCYCMLMLKITDTDYAQPLEMIKRFDRVYRCNRDVILTADRIAQRLISAFTEYFSTVTQRTPPSSSSLNGGKKFDSKHQNEALTLGFYTLCDFFYDILNTLQQSTSLRLSKVSGLIKLIVEHANVDPKRALTLSSKAISILQKFDSQSENAASKFNSTTDDLKQKSINPMLVDLMVRLVFPFADQAAISEAWTEDRVLVDRLFLQTIQRWFEYALRHDQISWSWAPKALTVLWQFDAIKDVNFLWRVIEGLALSQVKSPNYAHFTGWLSVMDSILDELEQSLVDQRTGIEVDLDHMTVRRTQCLKNLRLILQEAKSGVKTSSPPLVQCNE